MSNFGSYVKALRKASTHLTEELLFSSLWLLVTSVLMCNWRRA